MLAELEGQWEVLDEGGEMKFKLNDKAKQKRKP